MNLKNTAEELYKSILYRAADIYDIDYEDVERDIGQGFDPIIRFMAGALSAELERAYQHLNDTENRLQRRLSKVLLPEYYHLPQPCHALVSANAASDPFMINEGTLFDFEDEDNDKKSIAFSPVFPSKILPFELKVLATESQLIDITKSPRSRRRGNDDVTEFKKLLIGFESPFPITNWQGATFYFNLRGGQTESSENALFFAALNNCTVKLQKHPMRVKYGLPQSELILSDYLNGNERLQNIVKARYERHFITMADTNVPEIEPVVTEDYLSTWFHKSGLDNETIEERISSLQIDKSKNLYWLEIELSKPVEIRQLESRLMVRSNIFPVVNRRLVGHETGGQHYLNKDAIPWIPIQPKEAFLAIRKVYEDKAPEYRNFVFKPFTEFGDERKLSYTLRHGGVGRWDDFNAWQRLAYVVTTLQDNYEHKELVEKAAPSLSLEEIHHLLKKKVASVKSEEEPSKNIYVLLHKGTSAKIRVRVEYWTSLGEEANGILAKSTLTCTSKNKSNFEKESITFVTSTIDGRNPLNSTQELDAMKSAMLSRGRIVTREDLKVFCKSFLSEQAIEEIQIQDGVGIDQRYDFGMTRIVEVILIPMRNSKQEDWEGVCHQLQTLIEQQSSSSIPILVKMKDN